MGNTNYMNKMKKLIFVGLFLASINTVVAQNEVASVEEVAVKVNDSTPKTMRVKVDGVSSVVGDYVILESDIDKALISLKSQGYDTKDITRCGLLGKLMEDKLYMHSAIQDSIEITDTEVQRGVSSRLDYFLQQTDGDMDKLVEMYRLDSESELRKELTTIVKESMLTERMRNAIVDEVEITPEEVRTFFFSIPEADRPTFGESVEISQIVIEPEIPQDEIDYVVEKLNGIKADVLDNGIPFASKALLYSQDPGSKRQGGLIPRITRRSGYVKEFKDAAFSLQEGEISEPFETMFGWHILMVDKIRGEERDVRHILIRPNVPKAAILEAKKEADSIRKLILDDKISFEDAAKSYSDDKETKFDGGKVINPQTFDLRFELSKMDPIMYDNIGNLKSEEISQPILEEEPRTGKNTYKLYRVTNRVEDHTADYKNDYSQIQDLALKDKQLKVIKEWMTDKIEETYINISPDNRECEFENNWLKK